MGGIMQFVTRHWRAISAPCGCSCLSAYKTQRTVSRGEYFIAGISFHIMKSNGKRVNVWSDTLNNFEHFRNHSTDKNWASFDLCFFCRELFGQHIATEEIIKALGKEAGYSKCRMRNSPENLIVCGTKAQYLQLDIIKVSKNLLLLQCFVSPPRGSALISLSWIRIGN